MEGGWSEVEEERGEGSSRMGEKLEGVRRDFASFKSKGDGTVTSPYNVIENDENIIGQTFIIYNLVPEPF